MIKLSQLLVAAGLLCSGLAVSASSAQAFTFTTRVQGTPGPKDNIILDSIQMSDGSVVNQFSMVDKVNILYNDMHTGGNTGAASADRGKNATGVAREVANNESLSAIMSNRNLNNIVDTEDKGRFKINMTFQQAVNNIFLWERGGNSRIGIQAIDASGNLLGNFLKLDSGNFAHAGYSIETTEIGKAQKVVSHGISMADFGLSGPIFGVQLTAESDFNGPDFKLLGGTAEATPEPTTMAGMALAGAGLSAARRRRAAKKNA
jgi:hypothetical protein